MLLAPIHQGCIRGGCLAISEAVIGIKVFDMKSHSPICDADVRATKTPGDAPFNLLATMFPGPDAEMDCGYVGGTEPGRYEIQVSKGGFLTATTTVDVPSNGEDGCGGGLPQRVTVELAH
jgi:hypothetical protein